MNFIKINEHDFTLVFEHISYILNLPNTTKPTTSAKPHS